MATIALMEAPIYHSGSTYLNKYASLVQSGTTRLGLGPLLVEAPYLWACLLVKEGSLV